MKSLWNFGLSQKNPSQPAKTQPHRRSSAQNMVSDVRPQEHAGMGARITHLPVRPVPSPAPRPSDSDWPFYKNLSSLPDHTAVASNPGGIFELTPSLRQIMFILQLAKSPNTFAVITTKGQLNGAAYKSQIERIHKAGKKTGENGYADGAVISRMKGDSDNSTSEVDEQTSAIIRDIENLAQAALDMDASDIHIESRGVGVTVRMRVNGKLSHYSESWEIPYTFEFSRAMYSIADVDSKPTGWSYDCQMAVSRTLPSGARVKLRVQNSPAYPDEGLDVVIRVLRVATSAKVKSLDTLGYSKDHIEMLDYMLSEPHGLIVISGTTGSGKSTTLQTAMQNIRKSGPGKKLISIEDPPEYVLDGVTQIPVSRPKDSTNAGNSPFASAMRNTMRMDPDVIMIGEIRDPDSAKLMIAMVQSGHKVLTTLHAESSSGILGRLRGMGVDSDVLAGRGFISGLIFQTLVPTLCKHCRVDYESAMHRLPEAMHKRIRKVTKPGATLFVESEDGCRHCNNSGISGRTVCAEMIIPDARMRKLILANKLQEVHDLWRSQRDPGNDQSSFGATAMEHAISKMLIGEVSPVAVEEALGLLNDFSKDANDSILAEASGLLGLQD